MTTEAEREAEMLFRMLTDLETRRGRSATVMLERLPRDFAAARLSGLKRLVDARERPNTST
jgi:hypothetical protein